MATQKPITIVGGGLAGLTLGIGLRQQKIPATIIEAGKYPRHRVCGEFISGRGEEILRELGLRERFLDAGAIRAQTAVFFSPVASSPIRKLPLSALCLSRFAMDDLLAKEFRGLGGELRQNERRRGNEFGEGIVRATGRQLQATENGWRRFGLKIHARRVPLEADLEMHVARNGYVGLCRLSDGKVNVCGLFRRHINEVESGQHAFDLLRGAPGTALHQRMKSTEFDENSFCSVAGLSLRPRRAQEKTECCIGDALTMIPPVTGNGMSLAFESARLAVEPLVAFSRGEMSWAQAQQAVARLCDEVFARRLAWARFLQWLIFSPIMRSSLCSVALRSEWFWRTMFEKTR